MIKKHVTAYTDGSSLGNPGPGGYGVILRYGGHEKELSGGFRCTTNNRMELLAAIKALEALTEPCEVTLHTDSQYLARAIEEGWAQRWQRNGWMRNKKERALNPDLWARLLALCDKHDIEFVWIRGHNGDPLNERCDALAKEAAEQPRLPPDPGYPDKKC
ncbi:MAG: ribonuclease HI [Anaerolineae bacterium]